MSRVDINVTKTFLPPLDEYVRYLTQIWESEHLTNQGPLLQDFEAQVRKRLGVNNFQFVTNGTLALQLALRALDLSDGEIITTPFSYVATTSAILWEGFEPIYVDIDKETLNIDPLKIEAAITDKTKAILAVHVFGNPCDVDAIERIAEKHNLKVIYDAAHAFDVKLRGKSLLDYGDIAICSFHATKLFHTIEGGGLVAKDPLVQKRIDLIKRFGHNGDDHLMLGINAKASEFQAAMGLANLPHLDKIIEQRKTIFESYRKWLPEELQTLKVQPEVEYNYSYFPLIARNKKHLIEIMDKLKKLNIYPRRYFFPSLNTLPYIKDRAECPLSEDISSRILCLPLYVGLDESTVRNISRSIR